MAEGFVSSDRLTRFVRGAHGVPGAELPDGNERVEDEEGASDADSDLSPARSRARVRARTISIKRLSKRELERGTMRYPLSEHAKYERPVTRADCLPGGSNAQRPCPWVSCKFNTFLDVNQRTGSIKLNRPETEPWEVTDSCSLDAADLGGMTLEHVASVMELVRERVRQIEDKALAKLLAVADEEFMDEFLTDDPKPSDTRGKKTRTHVESAHAFPVAFSSGRQR